MLEKVKGEREFLLKFEKAQEEATIDARLTFAAFLVQARAKIREKILEAQSERLDMKEKKEWLEQVNDKNYMQNSFWKAERDAFAKEQLKLYREELHLQQEKESRAYSEARRKKQKEDQYWETLHIRAMKAELKEAVEETELRRAKRGL